jgi:hypothetical protein
MYKKAKLTLLLTFSLAISLAYAQEEGSAAYEQTRRRMWCETFRFIYQDNGGDSLLSTLNCNSWDAMLEHAQTYDAQFGTYRFYQAVDKPAIYEGISVEEQKLNKLAGEIQYKLMDRRKGNKRKEVAVDSLYKVLQRTALMMVASPEGEAVETNNLAGQQEPAATDSDTGQSEVVLDQRQGLDSNNSAYNMNEILQWLFIALLAGLGYWLYQQFAAMRKRIHDLRKKNEKLESLYFSPSADAPEGRSAAPANTTAGLTEPEVLAIIKRELEKSPPKAEAQPSAKAIVEKTFTGNSPKIGKSLAKDIDAKAPEPDSTPAMPEEKKQVPPQEKTEVNPEPAAAKPPVSPPESPAKLYDKMPVRGGFHQGAMSKSLQRDSVFTIQPKAENQQEAYYWVTEDTEVQKYAMQNGLSFFEEGCEVEEVKENPARVVNLEKGLLRKDGPSWQIVHKAKIKFE